MLRRLITGAVILFQFIPSRPPRNPIMPLQFLPAQTFTGKYCEAFQYQLLTTGGVQPITFTSPNIPDGLTISSTGLISGKQSPLFGLSCGDSFTMEVQVK